MREICHELSLPWPPEATFALLHTPSAVREWWSAARVIVVPGPRGLWTAAWGDDEDRPEYVTAARILSWEPPWRLRLGDFQYHTREGVGLPFEAALETDFTVGPAPGGCVLRVRQTGFPDPPNGDAFYRACQSGWEATLDGIRRFVQGRARPTTEGSAPTVPELEEETMFTHPDYTMVNVSDMRVSVDFYRDVLGLNLKFESPGWSEFATGATTVALHKVTAPAPTAAPAEPSAGTCSIGFSVPDLDHTHRELLARGARFVLPPTERSDEGIRLAVCVDPDGLPISFAQPLR